MDRVDAQNLFPWVEESWTSGHNADEDVARTGGCKLWGQVESLFHGA